MKTLAETASTGQEKVKTGEPLLELAERCEKATGPSAKLDEAIEKALPCSRRFAENHPHAPPTRWNERGAAFHGARIGDYDNFDEYVSPRYTASLDAAMTLAVQGISAPDVLRHAIKRCSLYGTDTFISALPRFVTAEWLRARAADRNTQDEKGLGG